MAVAKKWYYILGVFSIVLGLISLRCEFYMHFLENRPTQTLEELGGYGLMMVLTELLVIGMSSVGVVLGLCALYKRAIIVGLTGLIINLAFLIKTIADFVSTGE